MRPSKENCLKALEIMNQRSFADTAINKEEDEARNNDERFVKGLLASAAERLPKESSLIKDGQRKRGNTKVKAMQRKAERMELADSKR